jgi:hypothetical protein
MSIWTHERLIWRTPEWAAFGLVLGLLLLPPLVNGFPFLFPDSWGYSGACPDEMRSPVLGCAMRPFTWAGGNWAYAVVQSAATAAAIVLLWSRVLKRRCTGAGLAAVLASGVGLFSGWVMAAVWTLTGLICLFVIAAGHWHPLVGGALVFACGTHFGNFPTFATVAFGMLPAVSQRRRYAVRVGLSLAGAVVLVAGTNLIGGALKFGSGNGFVFLASRTLHDMPGVLELKCRQDPAFQLCHRKDEVLAWSAENHQSLTWAAIYNLGLSWPEFNRLGRELVLFSLREVPSGFCDHAAAALRNTWKLLLLPELSNGFETFGPDSFVAEDLRIAFPEDVARYLGSGQASGALERLLKKLDAPFAGLVWLATLICLLSAVVGWKRRCQDPLVQLAFFALIAVAANALFMANLSGVFGRYQARIEFLPIAAALGLLGRKIESVWVDQRMKNDYGKSRARGVGDSKPVEHEPRHLSEGR